MLTHVQKVIVLACVVLFFAGLFSACRPRPKHPKRYPPPFAEKISVSANQRV